VKATITAGSAAKAYAIVDNLKSLATTTGAR
jgi:hypothetical protein